MRPATAEISVLLPVWDGLPWLRQACLSALANELPMELVVVDDGSAAFARLKSAHLRTTWLAPRRIKQVQLCGAGRDAKRWCDLLAAMDVDVTRVFDLHPGRIGATIRGHIPVCDHRELPDHLGLPVLVAIGRQGGRRQLQSELAALGLVEAEDFLCLQ